MEGKKLFLIDETGIHVPLKSEVKDHLKKLTTEAFGIEQYSNVEGTEWDLFLDLLANLLKSFADAGKDIYNSISINNAVGATLDNLVALGGITRKVGQEEKDVKLRNRYMESLFSSSQGIKESLTSKLMAIPEVEYVNIIENDTSGYKYIDLHNAINEPSDPSEGNSAIEPYSILPVVYSPIVWETQSADIKQSIASIIIKNKSLGCGINGFENVESNVDLDGDGIVDAVNISFVQKVHVVLNITFTKTNMDDYAFQTVKNAFEEKFINRISNNNPGQNIVYYDIVVSAMEACLEYGVDYRDLQIGAVEIIKYNNEDATDDGVRPFGEFKNGAPLEIYADEKAVVKNIVIE